MTVGLTTSPRYSIHDPSEDQRRSQKWQPSNCRGAGERIETKDAEHYGEAQCNDCGEKGTCLSPCCHLITRTEIAIRRRSREDYADMQQGNTDVEPSRCLEQNVSDLGHVPWRITRFVAQNKVSFDVPHVWHKTVFFCPNQQLAAMTFVENQLP